MTNTHHSGFVSIIGKPNVGKSTLYNALMRTKLSITNPKAQTTRHRILGIDTGDNYQIVYSDTPGILKQVSYKLHDRMMGFVKQAFDDSDVLVLIIDANRPDEPEEFKKNFLGSKAKKIVCINKMDLVEESELADLMEHFKTEYPGDVYLSISATENFQVDLLRETIITFLPEGPAYYPADQVTDKSERFFVNETIRNHALRLYQDEVPYSIEVVTNSFKEEPKIIRIYSEIITERDSQKVIILGKGGMKIKRLGTDSRKDLEKLFDKKVYLNLFVKSRKEWRNNDKMLNSMGYDAD